MLDGIPFRIGSDQMPHYEIFPRIHTTWKSILVSLAHPYLTVIINCSTRHKTTVSVKGLLCASHHIAANCLPAYGNSENLINMVYHDWRKFSRNQHLPRSSRGDVTNLEKESFYCLKTFRRLFQYSQKRNNLASRKHAYIILTPLNPTFI